MAAEHPIPSPSTTVPRHQRLVYEGSPAPHLPRLAALLRQKLSKKYRCLYLNSSPMVAGMQSYLFAAGIDVPKEVMKGGIFSPSSTSYEPRKAFRRTATLIYVSVEWIGIAHPSLRVLQSIIEIYECCGP